MHLHVFFYSLGYDNHYQLIFKKVYEPSMVNHEHLLCPKNEEVFMHK